MNDLRKDIKAYVEWSKSFKVDNVGDQIWVSEGRRLIELLASENDGMWHKIFATKSSDE